MANFVTDPGYAASSVLEDFLTKREAEKRQSMLDAITMRKEARLEQHDAADLDIKRETLQALRDQRTQTQGDKAAKAAQDVSDKVLKDHVIKMANTNPGDVVDKSTIDEGQKLGLPVPLNQTPPQMVPGGSSAPVLPSGPAPTDPNMATVPEKTAILPGAQPQLALKMAPTYAGSPQQREAVAKRDRTQALLDTLPDGPEKKAVEFQLATGMAMPAGAFKTDAAAKPDTQPIYRIGRSGKVESLGEVPKGAHFVNEPTPQAPDRVLIQTGDGFQLRSDVANTIKHGGTVEPPDSASTRTMREGAQHLLPQIDTLRADAKKLEASGQFGPVASRIRDIMARAGTTLSSSDPDVAARAWGDVGTAINSDPALNQDRLVGKFAAELGLMATAAGRVHGGARGGGSVQMLDHFKSLLSASSTLPMFEGRLDALQSYMTGYAKSSKELKDGGSSAPPGGKRIQYDMNGNVVSQ